MTVTVYEKLSAADEAVEREFEIAPEEEGNVGNARDYCVAANFNAGREVYFVENPDEE